MSTTAKDLVHKQCVPCEGGIPKLSSKESEELLKSVPGWQFTHAGQRIRRDWDVRNFVAGLEFFQKVADLAEEEGHHPDLHLEGYRKVWIEIWTHAISGLSENDFILAAKINELPIQLKTK